MNQTGDCFYVSQPVCVALASILHVRQSIEPLAEHLGLMDLCAKLQHNNSDAGLVSKKTRKTLIENAIDNMDAKMEEIFYSIARRV